MKDLQIISHSLNASIFERLIKFPYTRSARLEIQYRMHPFIAQFPSEHFYQGFLQTAPSCRESLPTLKMLPPERPSVMFDTSANPRESFCESNPTSFTNQEEGRQVVALLDTLLNHKVSPRKIGVIVAYRGQLDLLKTQLGQHQMIQDYYQQIEVDTVDAFQGREKDVIIISTVRNNSRKSLGFLADPRRLNVAITRARIGLFILGSVNTLQHDHNYAELIVHHQKHKQLYDRDMNNLVPLKDLSQYSLLEAHQRGG